MWDEIFWQLRYIPAMLQQSNDIDATPPREKKLRLFLNKDKSEQKLYALGFDYDNSTMWFTTASAGLIKWII